MQDFVIISKTNNVNLFLPDWEIIENESHQLYYKASKSKIIKTENANVIIIGDFWNEDNLPTIDSHQNNLDTLIKTIKGNFFYFIITKTKIQIVTGFLNLLPIYYSEKYAIATSNFEFINKLNNNYAINDRYVLETFLFNHAFFNSTIYKDIFLLSTHHSLNIEHGKITEIEFWNTSSIIIDKPSTSKNERNDLSTQFISIANDYIENTNSCITFTSGFDGRTILSCALKLKKSINCISFGKIENDDVYVPLENAKALNIPYNYIDAANAEYINSEYEKCALKIVHQTGGFNGFLYPHFLYLAKKVATTNNFLITGYGGSELLRSTHIMGAITSKALYQVVSIDNKNDLKTTLLQNESLRFLSNDVINHNIDELVDDLITYKAKLSTAYNTLNKKLYCFILNESFRKIFGVWQSTQCREINVRMPYFDFDFVASLYKTNLAGIYNSFHTKNPIKRFKGQLLYALIIAKTNKTIARQKTGKGYAPNDLLSLTGKLKITASFFTKKLGRKVTKENIDNLSIISGIKNTIKESSLIFSPLIFNNEVIQKTISELNSYSDEGSRDCLLNSYSINSCINELKKNYSPN